MTAPITLNPSQVDDIAAALISGSLPGELDNFTAQARMTAAKFVSALLTLRAPGSANIMIDTLIDEEGAKIGQRKMRLAVVNDNMPFLVDSVAAVIAAKGLMIDRLLHPVLNIVRDANGVATNIGAGGSPESVLYIETERADARTRADLREMISENLIAVRDAVQDWSQLRAIMKGHAAELNDVEEAALLNWFADNHFTLLGYAQFDANAPATQAIGIARTNAQNLLSAAARTRAIRWFETSKNGILIIKSNLLSPVHRRVPLDLIIVPQRSGGKVVGLCVHAGLWTSAALDTVPSLVPVLRTRLGILQDKYQFAADSHAGKALGHAIASLPHDVLISLSVPDLEILALTAMSIADRPRPKLVLVGAPLDRHLFAFVWLPRDELTTARRVSIGDMLAEAASARLLSWAIELGDGDAALLRYTLDLREGGSIPATGPLNAKIEMIVRGWQPAVEASLIALGDRGQAARLALRYAGAFPIGYRSGAGPDEAALDILRLHALADTDSRGVRLYRNSEDSPATLRMKLYSLSAVALSDVVPALENFGFRVIEELSTPVDGGTLGYIQKFVTEAPVSSEAVMLLSASDRIENALCLVLEGRAEDDRFNQLIVELGLDLAQVTLFRALFRYLRQTGLAYGLITVVDALRSAPAVTHAVAALFAAHHNPVLQTSASALIELAEQAIADGLLTVTGIDDDRILRLYRAVVKATLRTNAFIAAGDEALAFKIDSSQLSNLPAPKPWREIFVYAPRVEGIHLRAGSIARGGLRWSDRRDDFRTEVLGLMKAQRVKNAVIVPTGAKGGFYPKELPDPANREAWLSEGTECYRIFIRTLLSITDNIVDGKVVHPEGIKVIDGEDPYFVVAADKGTATFSDIANSIAIERGFWLGDAFASGGSVGYDHKAMGITAKGAWVSVKRHFAEAGIDVQHDPVRVIGCGDMSGDVFGNGMLLSKSLKLVAAFDHRHIFFDPNPDAAASWKERARMFKLPRSSWDDYDKDLISEGGGVFARSAKSISLSDSVREMLGLSDMEIEPSALIAAILKAPCDLLWFGGIGTYAKARGESNGDVGDRANDGHRINAHDLRAKVIGEGANLGLTQAARIEFALNGGRINSDFIDNSAGVDCSDNEVNIKIALSSEMARGVLTLEARNILLADMTDDVSVIVLEDNRLQTLALSIAERGGVAALPSFARLIEVFEAEGRLDRIVEGLASNDELLRRAQNGFGLTRPELAILIATAKLSLQASIEAVDIGNDTLISCELIAAFPPAMQDHHRAAIEGHQLRQPIIATKLANRMVNRIGMVNLFELAEEESATLGDVALAFVAVEVLHNAAQLWHDIESADIIETSRLMLFDQLALELRVQMADLLRNGWAGIKPALVVEALAPGLKRLSVDIDTLLLTETRRHADSFTKRLVDGGVAPELVKAVVNLAKLDGAIGIASLALRGKIDEIALAHAFTVIGAELGLDWAQGTAMQLSPSDPWERLFTAGLARDFQTMRLDFFAQLDSIDPETAIKDWLTMKSVKVARFRNLTNRARSATTPSTAMLAQIAGQARQLLMS